MASRLSLLLLATCGWARGVQPSVRCGVGRSCRMRPLRLMASEQPVWEGQPTKDMDTPAAGVPIPFRPLDRQEVVDRLDAVPVFSVVNSKQMMLPTRDEDSSLSCVFYLDLKEAKSALRSAELLNPGVELSLSVTPLGTAFALCEWQQAPPAPDEVTEATAGAGRQGVAQVLREAIAGSPSPPVQTVEPPPSSGAPEIVLRMQANQAELEAVRQVLAAAPTPALLSRRNRKEGALPLFGSDSIRFAPTKAQAEEAQSEDDYMLPLFLRREDLFNAWLASGGAADSPPEVQVTDLRTLVWQMECDSERNWRPIILVAPDESIELVDQMQQQQQQAGAAATAGLPSLSKADALGLIFGSSQ